VIALHSTWKLHFSENITDVDLNALSQRLEHASQEKDFVRILSQVQDLMREQWDIVSMIDIFEEMLEPSMRRMQQILANDMASLKAPSETPQHQDVMKRVCKHLSDIAHFAMAVHDSDPENFKDMWIRGCPKSKQEMLIKEWKSRLFDSYLQFYADYFATLRFRDESIVVLCKSPRK
jgi:uncharacterized protein HemX